MSLEKTYTLQEKEDILILTTSTFTADRGSILHSGIYNREFSSVLAASIIAGIVYFISVPYLPSAYLITLVVFTATFPLCRTFLFKGRFLEMIMDKTRGTAEISISGLSKKKKTEFPIVDIRDIFIEQKKDQIENPDGVHFVEKISAQHGTVIPGFGQEKTLFILKIKISGRPDQIIHVADNMNDSFNVYNKIKNFLNI